MNEKTLGQRIRERRKQVGLSQKLFKQSRWRIWLINFTMGKRPYSPARAKFASLAEVLQCSPTWILFGDEDKTPDPPVALNSALDLSEDELEMLRLYRALPKSEQQAQISELRARVENFNRLFTELLEARKRNKHQ